MEIVEYREKYKPDFIRLNTAWIEKHFVMEQHDRDILSHPENYIRRGGMAFFAVEQACVMAVCLVSPAAADSKDVWEIHKLAADEKYQGHGAGSAVLKACIEYAAANGAKKLVLCTNHILKAAIHLYEKAGFRQVPPKEFSEYERADTWFELKLKD